MKTHYSAAELAAQPLLGLPGTERNIRAKADREGWSYNEVPSKGGKNGTRREYALTSFPESTRRQLAACAGGDLVTAAGAVIPLFPATSTALIPTATTLPTLKPEARKPANAANSSQPLKTAQLDAEMARERLLTYIDTFDAGTPGSALRAIDALNVGYRNKTLPGPLTWALDNAWNKRRSNARLTASTVANWRRDKETRGRCAPLVRQKDLEAKPWHALAVALKQRPQGTCLTYIAEQVAHNWNPEWGGQAPSYHTIRRFFHDKFSQIDALKGRHTGSALSPHKHYTQRTSVGMLPWDELHADGWNTHFTAPHPISGEYVTYEIWHAHDVATRYVPPFGIGLTENFEVIAKCVENAARFGGCMAILQTDSTRIVKNSERFKTNPATSLADRVGFTIVHPQTVGNSQANGIAENFNAWLDKESRELATYQGKGMDSLVLKRVKKVTAKAAKALHNGDRDGHARAVQEAERMGKGRVFRRHEEALAWLEEKRAKWNAKPHRALPKIRDAQSGALRHSSPDEALALARANGWQPKLFTEEYLVELFRTHMQTKVRREAVSPYGGMRYHDACLGDWNGQDVVVAYDIMDWRQVWVKTLKGAPICIAQFSEATGYRAVTAQQDAEEKRALAQIKHRERQIAAIGERVGREALEGEFSPVGKAAEIIDLVPRLSDAEVVELEQKPAKTMSRMELELWLLGESLEAGEQKDAPLNEAVAG